MEEIIKRIKDTIKANPYKYQPYEDLLGMCIEAKRTDCTLSRVGLRWLSERIERVMGAVVKRDIALARKLDELYWEVLRTNGQADFESFLLYVEKNREPEKKFYPPRRKVLGRVVSKLQELADDKLDMLGISLPPGTGKSTLAIFYLCWLAGKYPDQPMLTGSHSNAFVRGVYDECLRIFDPNGDYLWGDVFPGLTVSATNAKDCRIDLGKRKRFETLEFTSIGTGNAGLYRAATLLYCDDLVSGIEVALSKERLDKLWETYTTDLRQRKIGDKCKELVIATRWSVHDPLGRLADIYASDKRADFIVIPAVNEQDESNFDYAYGVGFTTDFYRQQREIMDDASWRALYMNQPIEREGRLYCEDDLQRYFSLPDGEPDAIFAVCDTKDRGADYCVMPIFYQYGDRYFLEDVVCDNGNPDVVEAKLVAKLVSHHVNGARFESNSAGGRIAQKVQEQVAERGGITKITTKFTTANKETKIILSAGFVKEHFLFKDDSVLRGNHDYQEMLKQVLSYSMVGRNKHDDAVDALAMGVDYIDSLHGASVGFVKRPF